MQEGEEGREVGQDKGTDSYLKLQIHPKPARGISLLETLVLHLWFSSSVSFYQEHFKYVTPVTTEKWHEVGTTSSKKVRSCINMCMCIPGVLPEPKLLYRAHLPPWALVALFVISTLRSLSVPHQLYPVTTVHSKHNQS